MFNTTPALLLNADYRPLNYFPLSTLRWDRAIKAIYEETAVVVSEYDIKVRSSSVTINLPSVVALKNYVPTPPYVAFTRFNVFLRDRFKCQYCGEKFKVVDLTFDHVVPRCDGGETEWENIVASCWDCNMRKDSGRLKPIHTPYKPTARELFARQREFPPNFLHEDWVSYLYWDSPLET